MNFTANERKKLFGPKLNKYNTVKDGKYVARIKINKRVNDKCQYKTGKKFDTIEECNAAQLKMLNDKLGH
jgi:hypothetical protein